MALHEILTRVSKRPRKENPTKRPKVPPSSATWELIYTLTNNWRVSNVHNKTDQGGEGVKEMLHLVPDIVWHLELDGQGLPRLVGDGPHGEEKMVGFHSCCLLLVGRAVLPVHLFLKWLALPTMKTWDFFLGSKCLISWWHKNPKTNNFSLAINYSL